MVISREALGDPLNPYELFSSWGEGKKVTRKEVAVSHLIFFHLPYGIPALHWSHSPLWLGKNRKA